ncbi:hypothetical protein [Pelagibacterium sp. H642]|uniref:hypothetical protein n=1 Tax=Pelagibacterium sp. H642 TaxID=1881069 RepID=UPI00281686F4|nr:hypothetical protein [Pelagibacterium sp. H642]WMT90803.1 hypothetical protein NO934_00660 [Pelagibacterium sp. H642]
MNPTPHIIPSALLLLAAFLIGCVIGYLLKRMLGPKQAPAKTAEPAAVPDANDAGLGLLSAPLEGRPDDLKKIKGVGPKLEAVLHENGIYHFHQIAAWDEHAIAVMNDRLSFRGRIERERWVSQAQAIVRDEAH